MPSQELQERGCRQQRTALGASTPDLSSRFTPEGFSMTGCGRKATEVLNQICSFSFFKSDIFVLLHRQYFWVKERYPPKDSENIQYVCVYIYMDIYIYIYIYIYI